MSGTASYATAVPTRSPVMTHHHLQSSPETCHWGFFEAKLKPVLTVKSGDEVTIDTTSGGPDVVPDRKQFHVPPELDEVHAKSERMVPRAHPHRSGRGPRPMRGPRDMNPTAT